MEDRWKLWSYSMILHSCISSVDQMQRIQWRPLWGGPWDPEFLRFKEPGFLTHHLTNTVSHLARSTLWNCRQTINKHLLYLATEIVSFLCVVAVSLPWKIVYTSFLILPCPQVNSTGYETLVRPCKKIFNILKKLYQVLDGSLFHQLFLIADIFHETSEAWEWKESLLSVFIRSWSRELVTSHPN
jgi:hypothetical protein